MNFAPVHTFEDLDGLDHDQVVEGHASAERGDPEPRPIILAWLAHPDDGPG